MFQPSTIIKQASKYAPCAMRTSKTESQSTSPSALLHHQLDWEEKLLTIVDESRFNGYLNTIPYKKGTENYLSCPIKRIKIDPPPGRWSSYPRKAKAHHRDSPLFDCTHYTSRARLPQIRQIGKVYELGPDGRSTTSSLRGPEYQAPLLAPSETSKSRSLHEKCPDA
ncbi:uncharacterized protein BO95DRAFT_177570 [Aspergillus brunneoviolaceus CBS 621.78]|uniref:Uncharacterized protein n=1 Tax=Aspergillus brunneoviolaceus CBS 621.78 TaxID=1450534 RepID=A0ACD1G567_9EURO|nr:hypothetical protein BO95DRAFT_177570 [Aspergillus brunneoviolaceus CBS 621.78]RAH44372.1 hypothetical protein BO95DRAFT_177570 [Aspergillus brunneoviolaceus CBS 621.78]